MAKLIACAGQGVELSGVPTEIKILPLGRVHSQKGDFNVDDESFGSILLIEGSATIENEGTILEVNKGESVFVDANSGDVKITGNCQWIYSRV